MKSQNLCFLSSLLCKWHSQATLIGKAVLPVLLLIRLVILGAAVQAAWLDDEKLICESIQPGCRTACFNQISPFAPTRFWTLQLLLVLAPGLVFLCYLIHLTNQENQVRGNTKVKGHTVWAYLACTASVVLVEVGFVVTQSLLYGFRVNVHYKCEGLLCPAVGCIIAHAQEKTVFLIIMFAASCISLLLSIVELTCVLLRNKQQPAGTQALQSGSEVEDSPCFLRQLLTLWHSHAGLLGKTILPVLHLIRLVVVGAAVQPLWYRNSRDFVCNTQQPGCRQAAFNQAFPFSLIHCWTLQVVLVLVPGLVFFCYLVHLIIQKKQSNPGTQVKGHVRRAYLAHLSAVILLEVGFTVGLAWLYGFSLSTIYRSDAMPCPYKVDCFISQAYEKSVFLIIMFSVACLSGLLTAVEMCMVLKGEKPEEEQQQESKFPKTSGFQMESTVKQEEDTTESNESCAKTLNI